MRARTRLLAISVPFLLGPLAALAQPVDKATDLKPFDRLQIDGCFQARLAPGAPGRAVVSATAEQQQHIRVEQDGKRVRIGFAEHDDYSACRGDPIRVNITASFAAGDSVDLGIAGSGSLDADVPRAAKLAAEIAGSGRIVLRGAAGDCKLTIAGSGAVDANQLACDSSAKIGVHGSGSVKLAGKAQACEFEINGSGGVTAEDFECASADVEINGSGSVGLAKLASLKVEINGSGNVKYRGDPTMRDVSVHGSGRIIKE
jgi:hypothetical protein